MLANHGQFLIRKQGYTHVNPSAPDDGKVPCNHIPRTYEDYLESPHWMETKKQSARIWGNTCLVCLQAGFLHRHHLFYRAQWEDTLPAEVIPLCESCHSATHEGGANKNTVPANDAELTQLVIRMVETIDRKYRFERPHLVEAVKKRFWDTYAFHRGVYVKMTAKAERKKRKGKRGPSRLDRHLSKASKKARRRHRLGRKKWLDKKHRHKWYV